MAGLILNRRGVAGMNAVLIENWNARVDNTDDVWMLGDFAFRTKDDVGATILSSLRGRKHLIIGKHDATWMRNTDVGAYFETVDYAREIVEGGYGRIWLCHYPMFSFPSKYMVYGHIHNGKPESYWPVLATYENALNACVEVNGYQPVRFGELLRNTARWKAEG